MKTNIALIGFMGTGKTAVSQLLARKLGLDFLEIDALIEMKAGKTIPLIFEESGEIAFRELEIQVTKEISQQSGAVIACGGGLVLNRINVDRLRQSAVMVNLTASPAVVLERVSAQVGQRPLLDVNNPEETISQLLHSRRPLYEQAADFSIDTTGLTVGKVADAILARLRKDASLGWQK